MSAVAALVLALAGCATVQPAPDGAAVTARGDLLPEPVQAALENTPPTGEITLAQSPWGANVSLRFEPPYHAATGRACRDFTIAQTRPARACRLPNGEWEQVRVLQHEGRPLLTPGRLATPLGGE